jgi:hypothetical protein
MEPHHFCSLIPFLPSVSLEFLKVEYCMSALKGVVETSSWKLAVGSVGRCWLPACVSCIPTLFPPLSSRSFSSSTSSGSGRSPSYSRNQRQDKNTFRTYLIVSVRDPRHFGTDPAPETGLSSVTFQTPGKKFFSFFGLLLF